MWIHFPVDLQGIEPGNLKPHTIRNHSILLSGGFRDRVEVLVVDWSKDDFKIKMNASNAMPEKNFARNRFQFRENSSRDCTFPSIRARADLKSKELIEKMRASLVVSTDSPLRTVQVNWKQSQGEAESSTKSRTIKVIESIKGPIRIENTQPPSNPEDAPRRELLIYDGVQYHQTDDEGMTTILAPESTQNVLNIFSPLHLLFDPAGLSHPENRFQIHKENNHASSERILSFRYLDGFHGKLYLKIENGQVLPARISTPFIFQSLKIKKQFRFAAKEKTISFENYKLVDGRMVPHKIIFDNGLQSLSLEVEELIINPQIEEKVFESK